MRKETKKKVRILGAVLFFLYLLALTYFLFFAEGYGRSVCLQPSALSGNQKILGSPGDAGDIRSILQSGGECDRLHSVWDDPAGHMAENGESFTDPAS